MLRKNFSRLDQNNDGYLSMVELKRCSDLLALDIDSNMGRAEIDLN